MAEDCARATYWVYKNISQYGGNPQNITLSGHSAGGHLAALIALDSTFKKLGSTNPIHKVALIDAFGLDMKTYFAEYNNDYARSLFKVFPSEQKSLEVASPQFYIKPGIKIPFLILTGSRTYPAIIKSSIAFDATIRECGGVSEYHVIPGKKHIGMISQLLFSKNKVYDILLDFMKGS
jgi:acetyl esterase/lipase